MKPVAWMIIHKGCEVGPVETMESIALHKAVQDGAAEVVPLYRTPPEAVLTPQAVHMAVRFVEQVANHELASKDCGIHCLEELVGQARGIEAVFDRDRRKPQKEQP